MGRHCIKSWAKTQTLVAKSSGESELYGTIRGSTEALGLATLSHDLGEVILIRVHVDANAAKGMVERQGLQKVRHLEVDHLWLQEQQARRMLPLSKVLGTENPADLMTKNVAQELVRKYMATMDIRFMAGRAAKAAQLHSTSFKMKISNRSGMPVAEGEAPDAWVAKGERGEWTMNHRTFRREMFTPLDVGGGPSRKCRILPCRRTIGRFKGGQRFEIQDYWCKPEQGHRLLDEEWVGKTTFFNKPIESRNTTAPIGLNSLSLKIRENRGNDGTATMTTTTTTIPTTTMATTTTTTTATTTIPTMTTTTSMTTSTTKTTTTTTATIQL